MDCNGLRKESNCMNILAVDDESLLLWQLTKELETELRQAIEVCKERFIKK